jgi:flavin-dependent dehydrogenase
MASRKTDDVFHVIILGGGPAGTSCGLALIQLAARQNKSIKVSLVESKRFIGEQHYNQCVGVLSPPLFELMERELRLPFPDHLQNALITGYTLHGFRQGISIDDEESPSIAVRRVQYDGFMLEAASERGVEVLSARATDLEFHADSVIVYTDSAPLEGDVVVGAFGLDEGSASIFSRHTKYRPPKALNSVVTKYHPGPKTMNLFGSHIHAFLPKHPHVEFGGITPKGNHLTINIAGRFVDAPLMDKFLEHSNVRRVLPNLELARRSNPKDLRYFRGRFPYSLAHQYFGDRYVMIGDSAGLVRSFKGKGVTTALQTGIRAAKTIMSAGVSKAAFSDHYKKANQDIIGDISYGRAMRLIVIAMSRTGVLDAVLRAARKEPRLKRALFGAVAGHVPYRKVWADSLAPASLWSVLYHLNKGKS